MIGHAVKSKAKEKAKNDRSRAKAPEPYRGAMPVNQGFDGLFLQRKASCACGGGCPSCSAKGLKVSQPNDAAEIEADRLADKIMRMPTGNPAPADGLTRVKPSIHRKCNTCEDDEQPIQRKALPSTASGTPSQVPNHVREALGSGGRALDPETRGFFEPRMGYDLTGIRIYTGSAAERSANAVDAKAYTLGSDIVFGPGQFAPATEEGRHLLAHELAHTVQQNDHRVMFRAARGAAAGCGICMLDPGGRQAGIIAHTEVQLAMIAHNPDIVREYAIPVVGENEVPPFVPEVDLFRVQQTKSQKIAHIGEIKPLDDAGNQVGIARDKIKDYARELKANTSLGFDEVFRMKDPAPPEDLPFFNPLHPVACPPQVIKVQLTEPGIYQYYCEPPFSTLVKDPRCVCKKPGDDETDVKPVPLEKPVSDTDTKDVKDKKPDDKSKPADPPKGDDGGIPDWVLPAAATAGLSVAAIAYFRNKAIEAAAQRAAIEAERRALQAVFQKKLAEQAAKKAAAGAAGKVVEKAVVYGQIAAAVALIALYPDRVEASVGPGASPIEALYKAMTTNGTPPSPEMKALIESDPILKQLAEQASGSGDGSKLQEELSKRTLQIIKDNPGLFSPEDLEFLAEYAKSGKAGMAPATADELRKAIDAAKAGKAGDGKSAGTGDGGTGAGKTDAPKPADGAQTPADPAAAGKGDSAGKGDTPGTPDAAGQPGVLPTPDTPAKPADKPPVADSPAVKGLNDDNKEKVKGAKEPVTDVLREYITKQKTDKNIDDDFIKRFFEIVPADLTPDQAAALIGRMDAAPPDASREAMLESLKKGVEEVRKGSPQPPDGGGTTGTQTPATPATPDKPAKTQEEIIADLQAAAKKHNFSKIKAGSFDIPKGVQKIEGHTLKAYLYGKTKDGVGYVGYITATIPADVDVDKLKKGATFTIEITSRSPMVDAKGTVREINLNTKVIVTK